MQQWQLVDGSMPAEVPEEFPRIAIHSEQHLREELARLRERNPGIVGLEGPDGLALEIGLGGPLAGVRLFQSGKPQCVLLADRRYSEKRIDFAAEEDTVAFWPDELVPVERALDIITYFYRHQQLPGWAASKHWDDGSKRWVVRSAR